MLPPAALVGETVRRVGLVGRAAEPTDVTVQMVEQAAGRPGLPVGNPGVASLEPATTAGSPQVVWVDLPTGVEVTGPVGVAVTATRGRFLWAAGPDPLVLLAVEQPDAAGTEVSVGGATVTLAGAETTVVGQLLPPARFTSAEAPEATSDQLVTVVLADLTLRYAP